MQTGETIPLSGLQKVQSVSQLLGKRTALKFLRVNLRPVQTWTNSRNQKITQIPQIETDNNSHSIFSQNFPFLLEIKNQSQNYRIEIIKKISDGQIIGQKGEVNFFQPD